MATHIVGLDAGHGGSDNGATAINGMYEKNLTLELTKSVRTLLLAQPGFIVYMTREGDASPGDVSARASSLIAKKCEYALSIHFNAFTDPTANGTEIYVPIGEAYGAIEGRIMPELVKLFKARNPIYRSTPITNQNTIYDKKYDATTRKFGYVSTSIKDYFGFIRTGWAGGLSADLLEICFITNKAELEKYIANKDLIAEIIARAIVEGFGETYKTKVEEVVPIPNTGKDEFVELQQKYEELCKTYNYISATNSVLISDIEKLTSERDELRAKIEKVRVAIG